MLRVEHLGKAFKGFQALADANLTVSRGEVAAVIGPNGAGKSTLFNLIAGNLQADFGRILFQEEEISGLPPHEINRRGMARSFQILNIFPRLSVFENVQAAVLAREGKTLRLFSPARRTLIEETREVLAEFDLSGASKRIAGLLSYGEQKVLEIALALACKPRLLLLDEPTAGMPPEETRKIIKLIKRLSGNHGLTILLTEHDMDLVFDVAERVMVLHQGRTIAEGAPEKVRKDADVRRAYLGETENA